MDKGGTPWSALSESGRGQIPFDFRAGIIATGLHDANLRQRHGQVAWVRLTPSIREDIRWRRFLAYWNYSMLAAKEQ